MKTFSKQVLGYMDVNSSTQKLPPFLANV